MHVPLIIAHRGGKVWAPENTMSAFRQSLEAGVDAIELDIQRVQTGELVVFHDQDLSRTTNGFGSVKDCSLDEIKRLSAGAWFDASFREEKVPLLQEVLDLVAGQIMLNIEIKNLPHSYEDIEEDLMAMLEGYDTSKVVVSSFDHRILKKLKGRIQTALLMVGAPAAVQDYCEDIGSTYFHCQKDHINEDTLEEAHKGSIKVFGWVANTDRDWSRLMKLEVDGIVSDDPENLMAFIETIKEVEKL